jgi:hypothetical protein
MSEKKKLNFLNLWSKYGNFNFFFQFPKKILCTSGIPPPPSLFQSGLKNTQNPKKKKKKKKLPPKCGGGHNFSTMATIFWIFSEILKRIIEKKFYKFGNFLQTLEMKKLKKNNKIPPWIPYSRPSSHGTNNKNHGHTTMHASRSFFPSYV